ncbi:hypothetical protein IGK30_000093 [Enterococcus sp. AZ178]|uniref:hypothetical protein n=1 Tax=Enterococcus sp. AZ178 TaxID=2774822 RepID=UPI003F1EDEF3
MKYRKKPVVIKAFQFDGDFIFSDGTPYVPEWAIRAEKEGVLVWKGQGDLYVKTLEGDMLVSLNDYVIQGINGELYPCKPDIFGKSYELVI